MSLFSMSGHIFICVATISQHANMPKTGNFADENLKFLMSVETVGLIYRRLKHILVQAPAGDTIYKEVMKKIFLLEERVHCCIINSHLEVFDARFV